MLEEAVAMIGVRTATEQDGAAIAAIYGPYVRDTAISFEEMPPTPAEMSQRVRTTLPTHPLSSSLRRPTRSSPTPMQRVIPIGRPTAGLSTWRSMWCLVCIDVGLVGRSIPDCLEF